ncbi:TetR/AcrR family transcriptional regulator [Paenibacillus soyae]|uniref:TetR/AcrR family transcriptional regulator n=1 Tax=Paenibacillus soyae TaxID=2969249 RepID=A0A9X2SC76_9BACL|nr:TetR/AcrR family transcriptional regulator [Paenibacillus soyae]MCR2805732.1 TetR/AcrR family transcriptional regulator [Paenibacillus soyae]
MEYGRTERVDPRIVRTRQLLKDAFIDLIQEEDVDKITVNRLTERATINRVTFYQHYRDIPDMMEKLAEEMYNEIYRILHEYEARSRGLIEGEDMLLLELLEHIAANGKFYRAVLTFRKTPIFMERLHDLLAKWIEEKYDNSGSQSKFVRLNINKDIAIWYGTSSLTGLIVSWLRNGMPYTPQYMAKQFYKLVSRG